MSNHHDYRSHLVMVTLPNDLPAFVGPSRHRRTILVSQRDEIEPYYTMTETDAAILAGEIKKWSSDGTSVEVIEFDKIDENALSQRYNEAQRKATPAHPRPPNKSNNIGLKTYARRQAEALFRTPKNVPVERKIRTKTGQTPRVDAHTARKIMFAIDIAENDKCGYVNRFRVTGIDVPTLKLHINSLISIGYISIASSDLGPAFTRYQVTRKGYDYLDPFW
jgi:hypothetical protein